MIIEDDGIVRKSRLKIVGRETSFFPDGQPHEDYLLVEFNGEVKKVGTGFYDMTDINCTLPEYAIIRHVSWDDDNLRYPMFIKFD